MQTQIFNSILRVDPTRTLTLRNKLVSVLNRKFRALKGLINESIIQNDCFGLNVPDLELNEALRPGEYAFLTNPEKTQQFMDWFKEQIDLGVLELRSTQQIGAAVNAFWLNLYIDTAYKKGMQRARVELTKAGYPVPVTRSVSADFNLPVHVDRVGLLHTRAYTSLKGITAEVDKQISDVLAQGMAEGKGTKEIASSLNKKIDSIGKNRSTILARTEIIRAHHHATIQEYENWGAVGVTVLAEWVTAGDSRVCEKCNAIARKKTKFGEGVYTLSQALPMIPVHPQCVTGDSVIVSPDAHTFTKTSYSGDIIELTLSNGTSLSVTPHHMLMTPNGLVMARFLSDSDYLLYSPYVERVIFSDPNYNRDISRIDNVVKSISKSGSVSSVTMPMSPEYFHGDGVFGKEDVNIIRTARFLKSGVNVDFVKHFGCNKFTSGSVNDVFFGLSDFASMFKSLFTPTNSFIGFSREFFTFFNSCILHSKKHGITSVSGGYPVIFKNSDYNRAADHKFFSQFFDRSSIVKEVDDFVFIDVDSIIKAIVSKWESSFDKFLFNRIPFNISGFISNVCERFPIYIKPVKILSAFTHNVNDLLVYDVSTMSTLYNVNGVLSSNCRCVCLPLDITDNIELRTKLQEL